MKKAVSEKLKKSRNNFKTNIMKKSMILFGLLILVSAFTVEANITNKPNSKFGNFRPHRNRPVIFKEHNITFYVFQNGDLDFKLNSYTNGYHSYYGATENYYHGKRKNGSRNRYSSTNKHRSYYNYVQYDYYGRVTRIGNTFIHYNFYGRVIAINGIGISYRRNRLSRVGNLRIIVDRYGNIRFIGSVKPRYYPYYSNYYYDDFVYDYDDDFFYDSNFEDDYDFFEEDDDFYYYRSKNKHTKTRKNGKKERKQKIIKRRKLKIEQENKHIKK